MAIWEIPKDKIVDYSPTGDDIDTFSQKTKYCLEEAFVALKELHDGLSSTDNIGGTPVAITSIEDGQTLIYDETLNVFKPDPAINLVTIVATENALSSEVKHLQRLVENLYLAFDVAGLNPGGYDGLSVNTFFGSINDLDETRTFGTLEAGKYFGENVALITQPISFINEKTGVPTKLRRGHLIVKHKNVQGGAVTAEVASHPTAVFVKGESLGVGTGNDQTVQLAHPDDIPAYKFAIYFDGEKQNDSISLMPLGGEVTFNAPVGVPVTADYFYNWGEEQWVEMESSATYQDKNNPNRATTQFVCEGDSTSVVLIRITPKRGVGESFWIDSFSFVADE